MPKEIHHEQRTGQADAGPWRFTISLIAALLTLIIGVLLTIYLEGAYKYVFGAPLVLLALVIPIIVNFFVAEKRR